MVDTAWYQGPVAGGEVEIKVGGVVGPRGNVLVRPDQEERLVGRRIHEGQRNPLLARQVCQRGDARTAGPQGPNERESQTQPVVERCAVWQPPVRQPRARLGRRGVVRHVDRIAMIRGRLHHGRPAYE